MWEYIRSFFREIRGCLKKGSRCLKADEAWEHRKLTSGLELEVGEMKEPKYLALVTAMGKGTSKEEACGGTPKYGAQ